MKPRHYLTIVCSLAVALFSCKRDIAPEGNEDATETPNERRPVLAKDASLFDTADEEIGGWIKLGTSGNLIKKHIDSLSISTKDSISAVNGNYQEQWGAEGYLFYMEAEKQGAELYVVGVDVVMPSTAKTSKGIGIGATKAEVLRQYGKYVDKAFTTPDVIVAGSVYDGLIFTMKEGRVVQLFLGAAAE